MSTRLVIRKQLDTDKSKNKLEPRRMNRIHKGKWKLWGQTGTCVFLLSLPTSILAIEQQTHLAADLKKLLEEIWWEQ